MPGRVLGVVTEKGNHKLYNKSTILLLVPVRIWALGTRQHLATPLSLYSHRRHRRFCEAYQYVLYISYSIMAYIDLIYIC